MAKMSLREYLNQEIKAKGYKSVAEAKKDAGKYKSIAAAKKAGSLYYTNKDGKVMAAVYAEDLKKKPKIDEEPVATSITRPDIKVSIIPPKLDPEAQKIVDRARKALDKSNREAAIEKGTKKKKKSKLTDKEKANLKKSLGEELGDLVIERREDIPEDSTSSHSLKNRKEKLRKKEERANEKKEIFENLLKERKEEINQESTDSNRMKKLKENREYLRKIAEAKARRNSMFKGGSIDRRKTGMFYKTGSPRGYR